MKNKWLVIVLTVLVLGMGSFSAAMLAVGVSAAIAAADRLTIGSGHGPVHHFHVWW